MSKYLVIFEDGSALQGDWFDDGVRRACLDGYCDIYMASQESPVMRMNQYGQFEEVAFMETPK